MRRCLCLILLTLATTLCARTVATRSVVANPGSVVSVPVTVDALGDVGAASFVLNYDATVVSCLGVTAGASANATNFVYADTGAGQIVMVIPAFSAPSGTIASVRFLARDGTQGLFSDVTVAKASFSARDGLTDTTVTNPVSTSNGMVRVVATDAAVAPLDRAFAIGKQTLALESTRTITRNSGAMANVIAPEKASVGNA